MTPQEIKQIIAEKVTGLFGKQINWANKDHKYRRVKEDWMRLCAHCHRIYDYSIGVYPRTKSTRTNILINCLRCKKEFRIMPYEKEIRKYCSRKCHYNH